MFSLTVGSWANVDFCHRAGLIVPDVVAAEQSQLFRHVTVHVGAPLSASVLRDVLGVSELDVLAMMGLRDRAELTEAECERTDSNTS